MPRTRIARIARVRPYGRLAHRDQMHDPTRRPHLTGTLTVGLTRDLTGGLAASGSPALGGALDHLGQ